MINEEVSLSGKFEEITVTEMRGRPGEVLASVGLGKTFLVTQRGKPVAVISKPPGTTLTMEVNRDGQMHYVA